MKRVGGSGRQKQKIARELQAAEVRKSCRTRMTMDVVREFEDQVFIYLGVSTTEVEPTLYPQYFQYKIPTLEKV